MFGVKSRCIGCVHTVSTLEVIICNIRLRILRMNNVLFLKIILNGGKCRLSVDITCVQGTDDCFVFVSTCFNCYTWQAKDRE